MDLYQNLKKYDLIPGIIAALALLGLRFFTGMPIWLIIIISIVIYLGIKFVLPTMPEAGKEEELRKAILEGRKVAEDIKRLRTEISKREVRDKLESICKTADKIFDNIGKTSQDAGIVKDFLESYLGTTKTIMQKYVRLYNQNVEDETVNGALQKVEETLDMIDNAFGKQLVRILQNEAIDLDVETEIIKARMELE